MKGKAKGKVSSSAYSSGSKGPVYRGADKSLRGYSSPVNAEQGYQNPIMPMVYSGMNGHGLNGQPTAVILVLAYMPLGQQFNSTMGNGDKQTYNPSVINMQDAYSSKNIKSKKEDLGMKVSDLCASFDQQGLGFNPYEIFGTQLPESQGRNTTRSSPSQGNYPL